MMILYKGVLLTGGVLTAVSSCTTAEVGRQPNIIYILADDLGYGDLGFMGQTKFATPNIDKLAAEGMVFTQHYSGSSVSAPSRSSLLTGLHTGHTPIRGNKPAPDGKEGQASMPEQTYNVMKLLKESGYQTGVFGKWGLGSQGSEGDPNKQGVDEFYGFNCQRLAHNYYPHHLWDNREKVILDGNADADAGDYAPYLIHDRAIDFIETNKDKPFFIYYASILPHAELLIPELEIAPFRGELLPEKSYSGVDEGKSYRQGGYGSQTDCHAAFAAMVTLLDKQVGDIVFNLDRLGLTENTIIIFTSDNGPHKEGGADPEYFNSNGTLRGLKRDLYEGGIRVPMVVKWSNVVAEGSRTEHISAFWDFLPTVADIVGDKQVVNTDGISYLPTLQGDTTQEKHSHLYWEFHENNGTLAIRQGDWKGVIRNLSKGGVMELYNLQDDLGEQNNVAASHPELVAELMVLLRESRTQSEDYKFALDSYNGGV